MRDNVVGPSVGLLVSIVIVKLRRAKMGMHWACRSCRDVTRRTKERKLFAINTIIIIIITRILLKCRTANSFENTEQGQNSATRTQQCGSQDRDLARGTFLSDAWRRILIADIFISVGTHSSWQAAGVDTKTSMPELDMDWIGLGWVGLVRIFRKLYGLD